MDHCLFFCSSSIDGIWLSLWYLSLNHVVGFGLVWSTQFDISGFLSFAMELALWAKQGLICERQWALYGIKCVLRIFWQTWQHIQTNKKKSTLCKHVPCSTLTHSTNEVLLNIKRKGDPEVSYPLSYVRYYWNSEPVCNKSNFVSLFYLYWYFLIY